MTDKELYDIIMEDETLQKYLDNNQFKKLYRYIKKAGNNGDMSFMDLSFAEFTAFLRAADIDVFEEGVVPEGAFRGDKSIKEFDFSKIKLIDYQAFEGSGIKKVVLRNSQKIAPTAFKDSDVEELYLGNGVEVGTAAFARCNNLKELYLAGGVKLDQLAFSHCRNLEEIVFDDGRTIDNWPNKLFVGVKHVDYVTIPEPTPAQGNMRSYFLMEMGVFDSDVTIDVLYINAPRDNDVANAIKALFTGINEIEFLK